MPKLWFPHGFNLPENYGKTHKGLPPKKDYYYDSFLKSKRDEFDEFYEKNKHKDFHLSSKSVKYCFHDVDILDETMDFVREFFKNETRTVQKVKVDGKYKANEDGTIMTEEVFDEVLLHCSTMPSACNRLFRIKFLKKKSLPIMPEGGYDKDGKHSKIAYRYLR